MKRNKVKIESVYMVEKKLELSILLIAKNGQLRDDRLKRGDLFNTFYLSNKSECVPVLVKVKINMFLSFI